MTVANVREVGGATGSPNVDVGDRRASAEKSATLNVSQSGITSEQRKRMEQNLVEVRRKKMARLSRSSNSGGIIVISQRHRHK